MSWILTVLPILGALWILCVTIGWIATEFFHRAPPMSKEEKVAAATDPWYWEKKAKDEH